MKAGALDALAEALVREHLGTAEAPDGQDKELPAYCCGLFAGGTRGHPGVEEVWWPGYVRQPWAESVSWTLPADPSALTGPVCGREGGSAHYHPEVVVVFDASGCERGRAEILHIGGSPRMGFLRVFTVGMAMPGDTVICKPPKP